MGVVLTCTGGWGVCSGQGKGGWGREAGGSGSGSGVCVRW